MPTHSLKYLASRLTGRLSSLPVLVLMPHSRCNCRCVMCDIWKANKEMRELRIEDLKPHVDTLRRMKVNHIVLSGGEALMHSNLWAFIDSLKTLNVRITLLSTGLLLKDHAEAIAKSCHEVVVSLDGSREIHNSIRGIPNGFEKLAEGVGALKARGCRVTARTVLQRANFRDLANIVQSAHDLHLDRISFLAADVSSQAFNRPEPWTGDRSSEIALSRDDVTAFREKVEELIRSRGQDFHSGFIAESPDKLRRLPAYYAALNGDGPFPAVACNAPWVSAVIEADGEVRPCFFHESFGNIHDQSFEMILNNPKAIQFRRTLDVSTNETCVKCVCTLKL